MLGAIAGDVIGSVYEWASVKHCGFPLFAAESDFTDDSVLTVATAHAILTGTGFADAYHDFGRRYQHRGYGGGFKRWLKDDSRQPYDSWGNGSAMRVSPVGWVATSADHALALAEESAAVTHNHPEGIRGAQAVALAIYLARTGESQESIREQVATRLGYDLSRTTEEIRPEYTFDVSCQGSVPEAIIAFLDSTGYEDAVRLSISLGGDADTQAAITGGIAEAFWAGVPQPIADEVLRRLPDEFCEIIAEFQKRFPA